MANDSVVNYLSEGVRRGFSLNLLKQKLIERGFSESDVNEAITAYTLESQNKREILMPQQPPQSQQPKQSIVLKQPEYIGVFRKIGRSVAHPFDLFEKTKAEGAGPGFQYLLLILFVPFILGSGFIAIFFDGVFDSLKGVIEYFGEKALVDGLGAARGAATALFVLSYALLIFIIIPLLTLLFGGLVHMFARLYGGKGTYGMTYSSFVYGLTPSILFLPIVFPWSFILSLYGLSMRHEISKGRAFFVLLSAALLIAIVVLMIVVIGMYGNS